MSRADTTDLVAVDDAAFWTDSTELRATLAEPVPRIPPVYGYDELGSQLFEDITRLPTYFLTRVEWQLLVTHAREIARALHGTRFAELGSGSGKKTLALLAAGAPYRPAEYVPVDVSAEMLVESAAALRAASPEIAARPLWGRYPAALAWLRAHPSAEPLVIGFLGSNLGNATDGERAALLADIAATLRPGDALLFSADLAKSAEVHETCYNDPPGGHTAFADFRLNHLTHLNRRFGADFVLDRYLPRAHYDPATQVVTGLLHVVTQHRARIRDLGVELSLRPGDAINVGFSAKFESAALAAEAAANGLVVESAWTDPEQQYGLYLARRAGGT